MPHFCAGSETPNIEVVAEDAIDPEIKAFQVTHPLSGVLLQIYSIELGSAARH